MAARRKTYTRTTAALLKVPGGAEFERACFLRDLLDGTIKATELIEVRNGGGRFVRLEYDEPDGAAPDKITERRGP